MMKKLHSKQIVAGLNKAAKYRQKMIAKLCMFLFIAFALPSIAGAVANPSSESNKIIAASTTTLAFAAGLVNLEEVSDRDTAGNQIGYKFYYVRTDQIDTSTQWPKANEQREVGTTPLKQGEYHHYAYSHNDPTESSKGTRGDITTNVESDFGVVLGSNSVAVLNYLEANVGRKFVLYFYDNVTEQWYQIGSVHKPYTMEFERSNNKDGKFAKLTFKSNGINQPFVYKGSFLVQQPSVQAAGATTLTISPAQNSYYIPNGTSAAAAINAIAGVTANDVGRIITLYGQGLDKAATIADSSNFTLYNSVTWTAKQGSVLVLKIYDTQTLVEVEGSRVQTP